MNLHLNNIVSLASPSPLSDESALIGGKAAALRRLLGAGFPVPPGICLTTAVFRQSIAPFQPAMQAVLQHAGLDDPAQAATAAAKIAAILQELTLPEAARQELFTTLPDLAGDHSLLAVRSSATAEDLTETSYAGQYEMVLGVVGETAVTDAILTCWRSFYTAHALAERAQHGGLSSSEGMAVLIQPLIAADCAGVAFSVDPLGYRPEQIVISAAWGLGLGVVDGSVPTDTIWVRRQDGQVERQLIVEKVAQIVLQDGRPQITPVAACRQRTACLPPPWQKRVAHFTLALEQHFGVPQDVEWAIAGDRLWILQSRPQTALPPLPAETPAFPVEMTGDDGHSLWTLAAYSRGKMSPLPLEHDFMAVRESIRASGLKTPSYFAAFSEVSGLKDAEVETAAYQLLDGEENSLTRLVDGLYALAQTARQETAVADLVAAHPPNVLDQLAAVPAAASFLRQLDDFLAVYGPRIGEGYGSEMTVRTPTWAEEPARVLKLVAAYLDDAVTNPALMREEVRRERNGRVDTLCAACTDPQAVAAFRREWAYARRGIAVLEDHNHQF